jgi:2-aminophenol/2-amino-5-chlorophenol 1,6-dioxygenase alpha subunit
VSPLESIETLNTSTSGSGQVLRGLVVPGQPQPLMVPDQNPGWKRVRDAFDNLRSDIEQTDADLLIIYSTKWLSVVGHQVQGRPSAEWVYVDDEWHEYGAMPYHFKFDNEFAHLVDQAAKARGLQSRVVDYHGFPIDAGSIVALSLLNPGNRIPAIILSSNMYSDRSETVVLAKATLEALQKSGRKAIAISSTALSNRYHTAIIPPAEDRIHSLKDHEWNLKMLEFMGQGRLEDLAQLSRQIHREARVPKVTNFKPFWWLSTMMGNTNKLEGKIYAYESLYGMGGAVVSFTPSDRSFGDLEYDEESPEVFTGDRNVLAQGDNHEAEGDNGE